MLMIRDELLLNALIQVYREQGKEGAAFMLEHERPAELRIRESKFAMATIYLIYKQRLSWTREQQRAYPRNLLRPFTATHGFLDTLISHAESEITGHGSLPKKQLP